MPTVYRMAIRTTRGEHRGRYKVTLTAKEGEYVLSVPQTVFGKLMYQVIRKKGPLTLNFGRRNAVTLNIDLKGIRPLGKTARKSLTYTPLRIRPKKEKTSKETEKPAEKPAAQTPPPKIEEITKEETSKEAEKPAAQTPPPKIEEITSATFSTQAEQNKQSTKTPRRSGRSKNTTSTKKGGKTTQTKGGKTKQAVAA